MKVYIENTGCTRRRLDLTKLHAYFEVNGYSISSSPDAADYILVSTCALMKEEEESSLQLLDSFRDSKGKVIVYGCLPVISPSKYRSFDYDFIPPVAIDSIDDYFENITHRFSEIAEANILASNHAATTAIPASGDSSDLTFNLLRNSIRYVRCKYLGQKPAYYLFTSRGCLGRCSYCAARFAIGTLQSKPIERVIDEFNPGIESGYRDFIVIGDDVGAFGKDRGSTFPQLLSSLLAEVDRKRAGTAANAKNTIRLYIDEFHPRWVMAYRKPLQELLSHRSIAHMLCPLVSGSDRILGLMERGNDSAGIMEWLRDLHELNPRIMIDTKVMAGFPSETEQDFTETLEKLGRLPLNSVIIVPYEEKENTPACGINPKVPAEAIAERVMRAQKYFRQRGIRSTLMSHE